MTLLFFRFVRVSKEQLLFLHKRFKRGINVIFILSALSCVACIKNVYKRYGVAFYIIRTLALERSREQFATNLGGAPLAFKSAD